MSETEGVLLVVALGNPDPRDTWPHYTKGQMRRRPLLWQDQCAYCRDQALEEAMPMSKGDRSPTRKGNFTQWRKIQA